MSGLNGRVRTLERQSRQAAGCRSCGGRMVHILEPADNMPSWLGAQSRCRGCGSGVKLIDREAWERL